MAKKAGLLLSLVAALALVVTAYPPTTARALAPGAGEVKIGFISAFTGVFSSFGEMQKRGAVLALEEYNYTVAGKKIVVIYEDDQLDNEMAVTKAKKLVEQDKVHILTGLVSGDEGLTVGSYMRDKGIPTAPMYSASEDMTMRERAPNIFRATWTGAQPMDVFGYWLAKVKGLKRIYMIGEDYSYPYNQAGGFKRGFCRGGGVEVKTVWHPVPLDDYSSLIAAIPPKGYDGVLYNGAGGDAVAFVKQYVELGMLKKIRLIGQSNTFERPDVYAMPKDIVGLWSAHLITDDLPTAAYTKFRDKFIKRWGEPPTAASEFAYVTMRMFLRAIDKVGGDVSNRDRLIRAIREVDLSDSPRGPVTLDKYNAAVENVYVREVKLGSDGKLLNAGLVTVKNVSQFGPYDAALYLKQPPDSKRYPPDKCADFPPEMLKVKSDYTFLSFGK